MGVIATAIYCGRNVGKVRAGDIGRIPVVITQAVNSTSQAAIKVAERVKDLDNWAKVGNTVGDKAAKVSQFASKITNPLLVGAAAIRVARDDDKKSALVEETLAMGGMFASERLYKIVRNTIKEGKGDTLTANGCEVFSKIPILKSIDAFTSKLDVTTLKDTSIGKKLVSLGEKISGLSDGKKKALFVLAELGLVATSILSFSLFKKLGKKITGRDKQEEKQIETTNQVEGNNQTETIAQPTPAFTDLTVKNS